MRKTTLLLINIGILASAAFSQTTSFTYQGKLTDAGNPPTAQYDLIFRLFDASGTQIGTDQPKDDVQVTIGIFTVTLDFGESPFSGNTADSLEIAVRPGASNGAYTTLTPRQPLTSSPYAVKSKNATAANTATNSTQLGGVAANQYVITTDSRMTDARTPLAGSLDYIQNRTSGTAQSSTSFNIDGNGIIGQTLSANVVTAAQFNTGAARVFKYEFANGNTYAGFLGNPAQSGTNNSIFGNLAGLGNTGSENSIFGSTAGRTGNTGTSNSIFGFQSGYSNTGGNFNSFFGSSSGFSNQTGRFNSFFGFQSGRSNTLGEANAFFGSNAGFANTEGIWNTFIGNGAGYNSTTGSQNTIVGNNAGQTNTSGAFNTLLGAGANVLSPDLTYATAIGAGATINQSNYIVLGRGAGQDTVAIPGNTQMLSNLSVFGTLNGNGSGLSSLNAGSITSGTLPIANGGTGSSTQNFVDLSTNQINIGGNKTFTGDLTVSSIIRTPIVNVSSQFQINGVPALRMFASAQSTFVGNTGQSGSRNSFFGDLAGAVTTGNDNAFFGSGAGNLNSSGSVNSFFGAGAGGGNASGSENSFFGFQAGFRNRACCNSFFGRSAGALNENGQSNSFFGNSAGFGNTDGSNNTFIGLSTGETNTNGSGNTLLGNRADVASNSLSNATAVGFLAVVSQSNSLVLGSINGVNGSINDTRVGIGTTAPGFKLHIIDSSNTGLRVQTNTAGGTVASFGGNGAFQIDAPGVNGGRFTVLENGNVGIGTNAPADKLQVNGVLRVNSLGSVGGVSLCWNAFAQISNCSSSLRYKTNIVPFTSGLGLIQRLSPIAFSWKQGGMKDFGLGAEDVEKIEPLLTVYNDKGEVEGVKYDRIGVVLINAVKEQQTEIERLRSELAMLKKLVCALNQNAEVCK